MKIIILLGVFAILGVVSVEPILKADVYEQGEKLMESWLILGYRNSLPKDWKPVPNALVKLVYNEARDAIFPEHYHTQVQDDNIKMMQIHDLWNKEDVVYFTIRDVYHIKCMNKFSTIYEQVLCVIKTICIGVPKSELCTYSKEIGMDYALTDEECGFEQILELSGMYSSDALGWNNPDSYDYSLLTRKEEIEWRYKMTCRSESGAPDDSSERPGYNCPIAVKTYFDSLE